LIYEYIQSQVLIIGSGGILNDYFRIKMQNNFNITCAAILLLRNPVSRLLQNGRGRTASAESFVW